MHFAVGNPAAGLWGEVARRWGESTVDGPVAHGVLRRAPGDTARGSGAGVTELDKWREGPKRDHRDGEGGMDEVTRDDVIEWSLGRAVPKGHQRSEGTRDDTSWCERPLNQGGATFDLEDSSEEDDDDESTQNRR